MNAKKIKLKINNKNHTKTEFHCAWLKQQQNIDNFGYRLVTNFLFLFRFTQNKLCVFCTQQQKNLRLHQRPKFLYQKYVFLLPSFRFIICRSSMKNRSHHLQSILPFLAQVNVQCHASMQHCHPKQYPIYTSILFLQKQHQLQQRHNLIQIIPEMDKTAFVSFQNINLSS